MPRQARLDIPGLIHHVMARGIEGRDIFRDDEDRVGFLKRLTGAVDRPGGPCLYAWAIMSNHFHLLLRPGENGLSSVMRRLMTAMPSHIISVTSGKDTFSRTATKVLWWRRNLTFWNSSATST